MVTSGSARLTADQIGDIGELLAALALSRPVMGRYRRPLFRPTHLGGKYPAADFLVDALDARGRCVGSFFVQVKSTRKGGGPRQRRLPVTADGDALDRLARLPAPAYLIGVDLNTEESYLAPVFARRRSPVYTISMRHPLSVERTRVRLFREVVDYWSARKRRGRNTGFRHD